MLNKEQNKQLMAFGQQLLALVPRRESLGDEKQMRISTSLLNSRQQ